MTRVKSRFIYEIADHESKVVYVGLTCSPKSRLDQHRRCSKRIIAHFGNKFDMTLLTKALMPEEAVIKEQYFIDYYKELGYNVLNVIKAGSLGSTTSKWCEESVQQEALKYDRRNVFATKSKGAYLFAHKAGIILKICSHMGKSPAYNRKYSLSVCEELAKSCGSRSEFKKLYPSAYVAAHRNGWLDQICGHMVYLQMPNGFWSEKRCTDTIARYVTMTDFRRSEPTCYQILMSRGWSHLLDPLVRRAPPGYWSKERCLTECVKYETFNKFVSANPGAGGAMRRNGWVDEVRKAILRRNEC